MQSRAKGPWLSYADVTARTAEQIEQCMSDARKRTGSEALVRREWAYGAYIGWRALTADMDDQATFLIDDQRLEALLETAGQCCGPHFFEAGVKQLE